MTGKQNHRQQGSSLVRASILIADEERLSREALGSILGQRGHDVYLAEDGLNITAILEQAQPRLAILSLRWLGINGMAVLDELRARHSSCGIIVLCPDLNPDDAIADAALAWGALDVLGRSTSMDRLLLSIDVGDVLAASTDVQEPSWNGYSPRLADLGSNAA